MGTAREADVLGAVVAAPPEGLDVVKLELLGFGATPARRIDIGTSAGRVGAEACWCFTDVLTSASVRFDSALEIGPTRSGPSCGRSDGGDLPRRCGR